MKAYIDTKVIITTSRELDNIKEALFNSDPKYIETMLYTMYRRFKDLNEQKKDNGNHSKGKIFFHGCFLYLKDG